MNIWKALKTSRCLELLEIFMKSPTRQYSKEQLIKESGISRAVVYRCTKMLRDSGLVEEVLAGSSKTYKMNMRDPSARMLKAVWTISAIQSQLKGLEFARAELYLFGSAASGDDVEESDIDILVIGKSDRGELFRAIDDCSGVLRRKMSPIVMSPLDYSRLARKDKNFYENIEKSKIRLV